MKPKELTAGILPRELRARSVARHHLIHRSHRFAVRLDAPPRESDALTAQMLLQPKTDETLGDCLSVLRLREDAAKYGLTFAREALEVFIKKLSVKAIPEIAFNAGFSHDKNATLRSEERRVGKECRSRWSRY